MKKWVILAFLLIVPLASATVNIDGPPRSEYNYGDVVVYSGYVSSAEDFSGYLHFKVICGNSTEFPYQLLPLKLNKGQTKIFPGEVLAPQITLSPFMAGDCVIQADVLQSGSVIESTSSNPFKVTPELVGSFEVEKEKLQKGEFLELTGLVSKLDSRSLEGVAEVYLNNNGTRFLVDIVNIEDGRLGYRYDTSLLQAGEYSVDVQVRDLYGNQKYFSSVVLFHVITELNVAVNVEVKTLKPGDTLRISGKVTDISLKDVASGSAEVAFNGKTSSAEVKDGIFTFEAVLAENIKSGKHNVDVLVSDAFGNTGKGSVKVDVLQVPESLDLGVEHPELKPLDLLEILPQLLDQAGDLISEDLQLKVRNADDALTYEKAVKSGQKVILQIPQFAVPGTWRIEGFFKDMKAETLFTVLEYKEIAASLDGMILTLKNVGNVEYDDKIEVLLNDGKNTFKVTVRESLEPNQTYSVNLNEQVPSGEYSMDIPTVGKVGDRVSVLNGKKIKRFDYIYLVLIIGVVLILVYELLTVKRLGKVRPHSKVSKGKTPRAIFKMHNKVKDPEYIDEFRNRLLKDVKRTEREAGKILKDKKGEMYPSEEKKKPKDPEEGNVFSQMFG